MSKIELPADDDLAALNLIDRADSTRLPGERFPVHEVVRGEEIPDLMQISMERWVAAVRPLSRDGRELAVQTIPHTSYMRVALRHRIKSLPPAPIPRPVALDRPVIPMAPEVPRPTSGSRQVNFRLSARDYERLAGAAGLVGLTPTGLARALVLSGVNRTLSEHAP